MVTPDPRGFPRTSNTRQICGHVEDTRRKSRQWREPPPERPHDPDLAVLFNLRHRKPATMPAHEIDRTPNCTAYISTEERQLYIPTGERHTKKDGTLGAEHKIPFILVTVTATIIHGKHFAFGHNRQRFYFQVTNRSSKVFDSRDNSRKPIAEVFYELHRMLPPAMADSTADALAEWLQPPRDRKPRKRKAIVTDDTRRPPPIPALRAAANTVARMIHADPVLAYLCEPSPYPDVKIS